MMTTLNFQWRSSPPPSEAIDEFADRGEVGIRRHQALHTGIEEAVIFRNILTKIVCVVESFVWVWFIPECFAVGQ